MRPLPHHFASKVRGVTFIESYPGNVLRLEELLARQYLAGAPPGVDALLIPNYLNEHDEHAVEVHVPGIGLLGHLPKDVAARLSPALDAGEQWSARIEEVLVHPDQPTNPGIRIRIQRVITEAA